jgi:hypothetical protein
MTARTSHLSSMQLDELALGLLAPDALLAANGHLTSCERCRGDLQQHSQARLQFERDIQPRTLGPILRRAEKEKALQAASSLGARLRRWTLILAPVAALAVFFLIPKKPAIDDPGPDILAKGGASLQLIAKRGELVFPVHEADRLHANDAVRLVVQPGESRYALIGSIDSKGHATFWFPLGRDESGAVTPGARNELPGSLILDDSPGPERIFALFSQQPIAKKEAQSALEALGANGPALIRAAHSLPLPAKLDAQATFLLEKEAK